jgi:hypothetical protein
MSVYHVPRDADWRDNVAALAVGVGVGAAVFYLARMILVKQEVPERPPPGWEQDSGRLEAAPHERRLPSRKGAGGPPE